MKGRYGGRVVVGLDGMMTWGEDPVDRAGWCRSGGPFGDGSGWVGPLPDLWGDTCLAQEVTLWQTTGYYMRKGGRQKHWVEDNYVKGIWSGLNWIFLPQLLMIMWWVLWWVTHKEDGHKSFLHLVLVDLFIATFDINISIVFFQWISPGNVSRYSLATLRYVMLV